MPRYDLAEVFQYVYDAGSASLRTSDAPSTYQSRLDYADRTDKNPVYVGQGVRGLAEDADGWFITKLSYDASDRTTGSQTAVGKWSERASITYA